MMSLKSKLLYLAPWALFGVLASGQALNHLPSQALGTLKRPMTTAEMTEPVGPPLNLLEGRELLAPQAVAVDTSATPAILYVADTGNNRVLAFRDPGSQQFLQQAAAVIGQRNMASSYPNIPGGASPSYNSGLNGPTGVAVDKQGNLFVLDYRNNRILRYPKPLEQTGVITADLVIGQPNLASRGANQAVTSAVPAPRADTLRFATGYPGVEYAALAFDRDGNLWVTDSGNHRVLRYPAHEVSGSSNVSTPRAINADYVLGQTDFVTATPNPGVGNPSTPAQLQLNLLSKLKLRFPSALAVDQESGDLYVADDLGRVLYWRAGFSPDNRGKAAARILGIYQPKQGEPYREVNDFGLSYVFTGSITSPVFAFGPKGMTVIDGRLHVADTRYNRIVHYQIPGEWPLESDTQYSPRMAGVFGQPDLFTGKNNRGALEPNAEGLDGPTSLAFYPLTPLTGYVFVTDTSNHRVLVLPYDSGNRALLAARAVVGQTGFEFRTQNFIEGREFAGTTFRVTTTLSVPLGPNAALDYSSSPPRLYIADAANHRVLGWADARRMELGAKADIVIGQVDFYRSLVNSPNNDPARPSDTGLHTPVAVAVDKAGHLYVADSGNARVLRFPRPFDQEERVKRADLVIGQPDFVSKSFDATDRTMAAPVSLAFTGNDSLVVCDISHSRVLLFARGDGFTNGMSAARVIGQLDYTSTERAESTDQKDRFVLPVQISVDADDNLYVADYGVTATTSRLLIFYRVSAVGEGNGVDASQVLSLQNARIAGVTASTRKGQFWIVDGGTRAGGGPGRAIRVSDRDMYFFTGTVTTDTIIETYAPRAVVLDDRDSAMVIDGANRATFHYPRLNVVNWANGFPRVAPAMIATLRVPFVDLGGSGNEVTAAPLPFEMDDLEVTVNGARAPFIKVTNEDARIIIPKSAPGSGSAEFMVKKVSTGETLAHSNVDMTSVSPAVITETPTAPLASAMAENENGTRNSDTNPAGINTTITVRLTGHGYVEGLPDDGTTNGMDIPTAGSLRVFLFNANNLPTEATEVVSSTLDPERPGVWILKIKVPQVPATGTYWLGIAYKNVTSYLTPLNAAGQIRPLVFISRSN
jgi:uncharacterized protein (TIGR03437 family)